MQAWLWRALAGVGLVLTGSQAQAPQSLAASAGGDYVIVSSAESRARAAKLLPLEGSEDARHLLTRPARLAPPAVSDAGARDFVPDEDAEWVVDIFLPDGVTATTDQVDKAFGRPWLREVGGAMFFGFSPEERHWTYVHAADVPIRWTQLAVAKELLATYNDNPEPESARSLLRFLGSVRAHAAKLGATKVSARKDAAAAAARARAYFDCWKAADYESVVALEAAPGGALEGRKIWDVMYSLGLEWGDGDLFHWLDEGGDSLFSVSTTTAPGYFLPEEIAAGKVRTTDLVFSFSAPRDPAPEATLTEMLKAARYAQKRLGGTLLNGEAQPFDEGLERAAIARVVARIRQAGLEPGVGVTLRIF